MHLHIDVQVHLDMIIDDFVNRKKSVVLTDLTITDAVSVVLTDVTTTD